MENKYINLKKKLKGPIYPIPPAFNKDQSLDEEGIINYVKFILSHNVRGIMVTAGTSRMNLLSYEEILLLNKLVIETVKKHSKENKPIIIAGNPPNLSTNKNIEFIKHIENYGADTILIYYPERYYNNQRIINYFNDIAKSTSMGILIHAVPIKGAVSGYPSVPYTLELCKEICKNKNVIGMKEENGNESLRYKLVANLSNRISFIVAGESMRKFMSCAPFGVQSYLVGIGNFVPEIEENFFKYYEEKNFEKAFEIVRIYEEPFFDVSSKIGWHIAMKGAMEIFNLMKKYERDPLVPVNEKEYNELKNILQEIKLIK
jgi:dihydrodipicolinate synthase/N-acetylneuraminate lyase